MAVGKSRHYAVERVTPRHFVESAEKAGLNIRATLDVIDDLLEICPRSLAHTPNGLPKTFPEAIADTIAEGIKQRLDLLGRYRSLQ